LVLEEPDPVFVSVPEPVPPLGVFVLDPLLPGAPPEILVLLLEPVPELLLEPTPPLLFVSWLLLVLVLLRYDPPVPLLLPVLVLLREEPDEPAPVSVSEPVPVPP
jgi:hypothetical protein